MSTHNIVFFMKKSAKLSLNYHKISSNTHFISSAGFHSDSLSRCPITQTIIFQVSTGHYKYMLLFMLSLVNK